MSLEAEDLATGESSLELPEDEDLVSLSGVDMVDAEEATQLNNLGSLFQELRDCSRAEQLHLEALALRHKARSDREAQIRSARAEKVSGSIAIVT